MARDNKSTSKVDRLPDVLLEDGVDAEDLCYVHTGLVVSITATYSPIPGMSCRQLRCTYKA